MLSKILLLLVCAVVTGLAVMFPIPWLIHHGSSSAFDFAIFLCVVLVGLWVFTIRFCLTD